MTFAAFLLIYNSLFEERSCRHQDFEIHARSPTEEIRAFRYPSDSPLSLRAFNVPVLLRYCAMVAGFLPVEYAIVEPACAGS